MSPFIPILTLIFCLAFGFSAKAQDATQPTTASGLATPADSSFSDPVPPVKIFLDTDVVPDVGDPLAIEFLHGLADLGEAQIIGISCMTNDDWAAGCVDAIDGYYGRPEIPVGQLKGGKDGGYAKKCAKTYPNRYSKGASDDVPDAVAVFRKAVSEQPDGSVVLVGIGPLTNLKNFLASSPDQYSPLNGHDLIARKVKMLSVMGGLFGKPFGPKIIADGGNLDLKTFGEYNIRVDIAAAKYVSENWPTPIVWSGFEIGATINAGTGFKKGPVVATRAGWDTSAVLFGVRGARDYWTITTNGWADFQPNGVTVWNTTPVPGRKQGYLTGKMVARPQLENVIKEIEAGAGKNHAAAVGSSAKAQDATTNQPPAAVAPTPTGPLTQAQLVAAIEQLGGVVKTEGDAPKAVLDNFGAIDAWAKKKPDDVPAGAIVGISFGYTHKPFLAPSGKQVPPYDVTDDLLAQFVALPKLTHLELSMCPKVTDAGVAHLKGLPQLQFLALAGTKVTDAGMADLAGLTQLQFLALGMTKVTDAGMANLERMTQLKTLWINETPIGDAGIAHLKGLTQLEWIEMWGNKVTDAGMENLKGLIHLRKLRLSGKVSKEAMKNLQEALPKCRM